MKRKAWDNAIKDAEKNRDSKFDDAVDAGTDEEAHRLIRQGNEYDKAAKHMKWIRGGKK